MKTPNHYVVKWSDDRKQARVFDKQEGYSLDLTLLKYTSIEFCHAAFNVADILNKGESMYVTGRPLREYDPDIRELEIDPSLLYIDVGAGLGVFIPHVVRCSKGQAKVRPIAIDPVNYELMQRMLVYAGILDVGDQMKEHLKILIDRCEIMLDSTKVQLIKSTLEQSLNSNSHLQGVADVVIDNAGANHYAREDHEHIWKLEKQLLKPNGRLFSEVVKSSGIYRPPN